MLHSRQGTVRFASVLTTKFREDFHLQTTIHAGHTRTKATFPVLGRWPCDAQVPPTGLEPVTPSLGNWCSIHLSYEGGWRILKI